MQQVKVPKNNLIGRTIQDSDGSFLYEVTKSTDIVPNIDALHARGISIDSHPAEWFNLLLQIYKKCQENPNSFTIEDFTTWSNKNPTYQMLEQEVVNTQSGYHSQLKK